MGSRCYIGRLLPNKKYKAIYCHDGANDKESEKDLLTWNTTEKVDKLLEYGNISSINIYPMVANKDTYDSRYAEMDKDTYEWIHPYFHDVRKPRRVHDDDKISAETWNKPIDAIDFDIEQIYVFYQDVWFKFDKNFKNLVPLLSTLKGFKTATYGHHKPRDVLSQLENAYKQML